MIYKLITICFILFLAKHGAAQQVTKQSEVLILKGKNITMPGKQMDINADGLPAMIKTSFDLITEPIHFHVVSAFSHKDIKWKNGTLKIKSKGPDKANWTVKNTSDSVNMDVSGQIKSDGTLNYVVKLTALDDINLDNIRLHLPFTVETAKYIKGLGDTRRLRPNAVDWKWASTPTGLDLVWVGDVKGGLQYQLTDQKHQVIPESWANNGRGGIHIEQKGKAILSDNYSGEQHLKKGEVRYYNFNMHITSDSN